MHPVTNAKLGAEVGTVDHDQPTPILRPGCFAPGGRCFYTNARSCAHTYACENFRNQFFCLPLHLKHYQHLSNRHLTP